MLIDLEWFDVANNQVNRRRQEFASIQDAEAQTRGAGHIVLGARVVRGLTLQPLWRDRETLHVGHWCRELHALVQAGMTVVEALDTMRMQAKSTPQQPIHDRLVEQLQAGKPLSEAMRQAAAFPAVLLAGVKASERSSALLSALDDYIQYDDAQQRLRKQIASAAIYPAVVMLVGVCIVAFLLLFVMPRFAQLYIGHHGAAGGVTQVLIALSRLLQSHPIAAAVVLAATLIGPALAWRHPGLRTRLSEGLTALPGLRQAVESFRLAKLYRSLALLFRGGYPMPEALHQCEALGLGGLTDERVRSAHRALLEGARVSAALADNRLADDVAQRLIAVGERSGSFDQVLQSVADRHAQHFSLLVERATRLVEPMLLLLVALAVGSIVVAMYMPIFDMTSGVK